MAHSTTYITKNQYMDFLLEDILNAYAELFDLQDGRKVIDPQMRPMLECNIAQLEHYIKLQINLFESVP